MDAKSSNGIVGGTRRRLGAILIEHADAAAVPDLGRSIQVEDQGGVLVEVDAVEAEGVFEAHAKCAPQRGDTDNGGAVFALGAEFECRTQAFACGLDPDRSRLGFV